MGGGCSEEENFTKKTFFTRDVGFAPIDPKTVLAQSLAREGKPRYPDHRLTPSELDKDTFILKGNSTFDLDPLTKNEPISELRGS